MESIDLFSYHQEGNRWVADVDYQERHKPKQAGFRWDAERKHWYTNKKSVMKPIWELEYKIRYPEPKFAID